MPRQNPFIAKAKVDKFGNSMQLKIRIVKNLFLFLFGWLSLTYIDFVEVINSAPVDWIIWATIFMYFLSWVNGTLSDGLNQQSTYQKLVETPSKYKLLFASSLILIILGLLLLYNINEFRVFICLVFLFWVYNYLLWHLYAEKIIKPTHKANRKSAQKKRNFYLLEKIESSGRFLYGRWVRYRFIFGIVFLSFILLFNFSNSASEIIQNKGYDLEQLSMILVSFHILIGESWIWLERLKRSHYVNFVTDIESKYKIQ